MRLGVTEWCPGGEEEEQWCRREFLHPQPAVPPPGNSPNLPPPLRAPPTTVPDRVYKVRNFFFSPSSSPA